MTQTTDPDTTLRKFSAGYALTEFHARVEDVDGVYICSHRADDIRAWWTERGLPVVIRQDARHIVADESPDVEYDEILVPDYMAVPEGTVATLIPTASHTRLITGFEGEDD